MTYTIRARDLSPLEGLSADDESWLAELQAHVRASNHVVRLGEAADDGEDFVVSRDPFGRWWAGRYIGEVALGDTRLEIRPRLGDVVIEEWLGEALSLVAVPQTSARQRSESFIARLMAAVWCRAVDQASRHGPPSFRRDHQLVGPYVRGRLDIRRTTRLRAGGSPHVASTQSYRDLDNDVSRTMVAAERALTARIGHDHWHTPRVDEMLPWLRSAVGSRPRLPARRQLGRIRYTPITRQFRSVAELSWRLAQLQGYSAAREEGESEGLLVDVAELWELFVVKCIARAFPELRVEHGTHGGDTTWLLSSASHPGAGLGRLKPDVLAYAGKAVVVVADAKYKRLEDRWPERPQGVDRADLYQLTSYLARFSAAGEAQGLLLYPDDPERDIDAYADTRGPWRTEGGASVLFKRLALRPDDAVAELAALQRSWPVRKRPLLTTHGARWSTTA